MKICPISDIHNTWSIFDWIGNNLKGKFDILTISGDVLEGKDIGQHMRFKDMMIDFQTWIEVPIVMIQGNHCWYSPSLFDDVNDIHLLNNSGIEIDNKYFWGSPLTPIFFNWNNMATEDKLYDIWMDLIPDDVIIDVGLFHGPPHGFCDTIKHDTRYNSDPTKHIGSTALRDVLHHKRFNKLFVGHMHSGERYQVKVATDGFRTEIYNVSCVDENYEFGKFNPMPHVVEI